MIACQPCRERAVRRLDGVVAVVDADNDAHEHLPFHLVVLVLFK